MPSFQSFQECPHQKLFFDLKDKNYKKAKMKGELGWMKKIGNDPRSLFNGNHFSSIYNYVGMLVCRYVCHVLKCIGGITYAHAQSLFWAVKTDHQCYSF